MAGILVCPACGGKLRVGTSAAPGSAVYCPHCSQAIRVRATTSLRPASLTAPLRPLPRRKADNATLYVVGTVATALVLVFGLALIVVLARMGNVASDSHGEDPEGLPPSVARSTKSGRHESPAAGNDFRGRGPAGDFDSAGFTRSPGQPEDLLARIDPTRDALGGTWTREGDSLVCPGGSRWALVVPQPPPAGYRWTIVAERISGYGSVGLCLLIEGRQTMAVLEGYGKQFSGLSRLDGRTADRNETTRRGSVFRQDGPTTIVCTVGRSRVRVACDGEVIIDWTGKPSRLSFDRYSWPDLPADRLAVTSFQGVRIRISKMELVEVDPGETPPPDSLAASSAAEWPMDFEQMMPDEDLMPDEDPAIEDDPAADEESDPSGPPWDWSRPFGGRPPWMPPRGSMRPPTPGSRPSTTDPSPPTTASRSRTPIIPFEELPEAVLRSKESICIIEFPLGSGTGFVVGENIVATNAHVVSSAYVDEIECHFSSAGILKCRAKRVLFEDTVRDLALLEVDTDQAPIPATPNHAFRRGQKVVIIGNPSLGETDIVLRDAVMGGTINAVVHTDSCDFYQIDASVNPGSSGGPVLNLDGEVVGVVAMKATRRGEYEIRRALRELDDNFASPSSTFTGKGITFGIPVNALGQAMEVVQGQSDSAAAAVSDRHMALVLLDRLTILGELHLLELQVNVPMGVRQQAANINLRNVPTSTLNKLKFVPLINEWLARELARKLESEEVQKMVRISSKGLAEKVAHLGESEHFDQATARNLQNLLHTVQETKGHADDPPNTYQMFSQVVSKQTDTLKESVKRLADQLDAAKAGYEE